MQHFPTSYKGESTDYPYGSLMTTAYFGMESKAGHGFRTTFQTINPKNGRLNKPKVSTYCDLGLMYQNPDNGHFEYTRFSPRSLEELQKAWAFFVENYDLFSSEEIEQFLMFSLALVRAEAKGKVAYCGAKSEDVIQVISPTVEMLVQMIKEPTKFGVQNVGFPIEGLKALAVPGFNPFKVSNHGI